MLCPIWGLKAESEVGGFQIAYAQGAAPGSTGSHMPPPNATLIAAAVAAVKGADVVLVNLGLGNAVEGESRDRTATSTLFSTISSLISQLHPPHARRGP